MKEGLLFLVSNKFTFSLPGWVGINLWLPDLVGWDGSTLFGSLKEGENKLCSFNMCMNYDRSLHVERTPCACQNNMSLETIKDAEVLCMQVSSKR